MQNETRLLSDKKLLIIFVYAPAGLGHLRVTEALYHGLPKSTTAPLLLGAQDTGMIYLHRLVSLNPVIHPVSDFFGYGFSEDLITAVYRFALRHNTNRLYRQMVSIISQQYNPPARILVVATHFGLAHQLAALKEKLESRFQFKMHLVVQVTDDSPHHIWYVGGADLIVVPSEKTKNNLVEYGQKIRHFVPVMVNAYPLNPELNYLLPVNQLENKIQQTHADKAIPIQIVIPISGAAIGTEYFRRLIVKLHEKSDRFTFHVVCKDSGFTKNFIGAMQKLSFVRLYRAVTDKKVIENYDLVYQKNVISLEFTKPSEQSFKALLSCDRRAAPILFLTSPVGQQEVDNLDFLRRHQLIPTPKQQEKLWLRQKDSQILNSAFRWRGICLKDDPDDAADFINWSLESGLLAKMIFCRVEPVSADPQKLEMEPDGVKKFWKIVENKVLKG